MAENTVEIVVKARDNTKAGFASAAAEADAGGALVEASWSKHLAKLGDDLVSGLGNSNKQISKLLPDMLGDALNGATNVVSSALSKVLPEGMSAAVANPVVLAAAAGVGVIIAALIAQALGGALIVGLGAVLTGAAIYAAMKSNDVQKAFDNLKSTANHSLTEIGVPFQSVMDNIFKTASATLGKLTPVFAAASKTIAGPFQQFSDALIKAFGQPAVQKSIQAVATAFGQILTALTPTLAKDVGDFATGITNIAKAISANPQAFAQFITFLVDAGVIALDLIADLTKLADYLEKTWGPVWKAIGPVVKGVWDDIKATVGTTVDEIVDIVRVFAALFTGNWTALWNAIKDFFVQTWNGLKAIFGPILDWFGKVASDAWNGIENVTKSVWNDITKWLSSAWNGILDDAKTIWNKIISWFDDIKGWIEGAFKSAVTWLNGIGKDIITGLWNGLKSVWNSVSSWFGKIGGWIKSAFDNAGNWLWNAGYYVVEGLWNGMKNIWDKVTSWISSIAGWIKAHKGPISLDQNLLVPAGEAIMNGFYSGLKSKYANVESFIGGVANKVSGVFGGGSGVARWKSTVDQALRMEGLPVDLDANVLYQMQTESGGNPNAINLTDSNAAAGDPSRGLMQTIMTTFEAYHWPGTSNNIYDPLANIAAAINYARHVYGPNLANQYGGIGSGHGYAAGGPASGWAMVGEHGRELVRLPTGSQVYPNGATEAAQSGGSSGTVQLQVSSSGQSDFENFMVKMIKQYVRVHGGRNVQTAFGS